MAGGSAGVLPNGVPSVSAVGNFAPHNPTRAYMEWIGNWYLVYRTAEHLARLADQAEIAESRVAVGREALRIDLFLIGRR